MSKSSKESKKRDSGVFSLTTKISIIVFILAISLGYYLGYKDSNKEIKHTSSKETPHVEANKTTNNNQKHEPVKGYTTTIPELTKRLQSVLKHDANLGKPTDIKDLKLPPKVEKKEEEPLPQVEEVIKKYDEVLKALKSREEYDLKTAAHEYKGEKAPIAPVKRKIEKRVGKAKLAIIIDDVSFSKDVKAIKRLNLPITMSFLPPTSWHPNSGILASKESFYMVHLPLEAQKFNANEPFTLTTSDTQQYIDERIEELVKIFPKVKYMNNHTGSKFTASEISMNKLITTLKKYDIEFVDSRTTSKTKVRRVMKNFNKRYLARDVFLDHHPEKNYVKKQIKEAIKIAKMHGTAIAIGHPRYETLLAIEESKDALKEIELVRIDRLY